MDESATGTGEEITKETDTHNGSEDGLGEFNWRMKFPLVIPCKFPRLRIQGYDFSPLGSQIIGETVISLKKIIRKLNSEGKYTMTPIFYKLFSSNSPD